MSDLDSFAFEPGQQVECKTRYDDLLRGEVVAFDLSSKVLIIKSPTSESTTSSAASKLSSASTTALTSNKAAVSASSNSGNHDLHCLVLDSVSEVEILEEPQQGKCNNDLPTIGMKSVNAKCLAAYNERYHIIDAVSNGVSQDGISLYKSLSKTYSEINWKDKIKIEVMNSVVISPPYQESDCKALSNSKQDEKAVTYVKSLVAKFWDDNSKQKSSSSTNAQQQQQQQATDSSTTSAAATNTTTTTSISTATTTSVAAANNQAVSKTPAGPASAHATGKIATTTASS